MSLGKYRAIDLAILTFVACGLDAILLFFKSRLAGLTYFWLSCSMIVSLIAMIRWSWWGLIPTIVSAVFYMLFSYYAMGKLLTVTADGTILKSTVIYAVGTLFISIEMLYIHLLKKDRICRAGWLLVLYVVIGYLSIVLGRTVVALCFGDDFLISLVGYLQADSLNIIWTIIILFIANKQDGMLCDQKEYFLEVRGRR